jgi:hypothetical protein
VRGVLVRAFSTIIHGPFSFRVNKVGAKLRNKIGSTKRLRHLMKCKMQKCKNAKKKADIIATAAYFFSKGLKGLKGFKGFKSPLPVR